MEMADYASCQKTEITRRRAATDMRSATTGRVKRTLIALLLMFVISFVSVFAETEAQTDNTGDNTKADVAAETGDTGQVSDTQQSVPAAADQTPAPAAQSPAPVIAEQAPVPAPNTRIVRKGRYYYYRYANGKIRKKAGFVTVDGYRYYIRKGGKITTGKAFKIKKKYYRANKYGVIMTGIYSWKGSLYYSSPVGVQKKKAGFVSWNGYSYYVKKGGKVAVNEGFSVNNIPYGADWAGCATMLDIPDGDGSTVVQVAKAQVGVMTGKTYWVWYFKTKFKNTDRTPWCGAFVAWCYNAAGQYDRITVAKQFGNLGYVPSYSRYADSYGKWINRADAKGGDIIIFGRNSHVGLVEGITGEYIITIEGNAGPTAVIGSGKPGAVVRNAYRIDSKKIKGIIRPD